MVSQATLGQAVRAVGTGLHSGKLIEMTLKPAAPHTGIVFSRTDLGGASLKACVENIDFSALQMATTLRSGHVVIQTTEHLLSALYACGVNNVLVELSGSEVPIMDGSSAPFLVLLEEAGIKRQPVPQKVLRVKKPFVFEADGKRISVEPAPDFRISYEIQFDHPLIQKQEKTLCVVPGAYENEIAPARTFGFLRDVNYLKSKGLIKGGSLENAIVLDGDRILNESLRFDDEFVSHKILDLIGDFSLCGYRFQGHVKAVRAGHELHALFLKALLERPELFSIVVPETEQPAVAQTATPRPKPVFAGAA